MKFISLFAGVGGFDLGMERGGGHECVAQVEWDKNAAGVLKRRWPDVPLFCDVSKVTGFHNLRLPLSGRIGSRKKGGTGR